MKAFFYRAKSLIWIFLMVSMLTSLTVLALEKQKVMKNAFPYFTPNGVVGNMNQNEQDDSKLSKMKFANLIKNASNTYYYCAELDGINSYSVFYSEDVQIKIPLIWGTFFSIADFAEKRNVAVCKEEFLTRCMQSNRKYYFAYGGVKYRIVGVYQDYDQFGNESPDMILNYLAAGLDDTILNCNYFYDSGEDSLAHIESISNEAKKKSPTFYIDYYAVKEKESGMYIRDKSNIKAMTFFILGLTLLVFLNSFSACDYWLQGRRREIGVRRMLGAGTTKIRIWIVIEFVKLFTFSFVGSVFMTELFLLITPHLPVAESTELMFGHSFSVKVVIISYTIVVSFGIFLVLVRARPFYKTEIKRELK